MLDWIAGFVGRWTGAVGQAVVDLVHWSVHALASVVYFVFGAVGKAWSEVWGALGWQLTAAARFVDSVYQLARRILKTYFPAVYNWIAGLIADVRKYIRTVWDDLLRGIAVLKAWAVAAFNDARKWVLANVWAPLVAEARQLRADLLKWGYTAWWYITHPDKLAALLLLPLIAAAEAAVWQISGPVLAFATRLILANARRVALLAEEVFTSVF